MEYGHPPKMTWNYKSTWRGAAAVFRQRVNKYGQRATLNLVERIYFLMPGGITFKNSKGDMNICSHVYRWDREPYELVFELGFEARRQANTPYESYFNLESFFNGARRPLDIIRDTTHDFISTTLTSILP
ncbi:hypothetical protein Tco_0070611 [Tanacetum coccineum]